MGFSSTTRLLYYPATQLRAILQGMEALILPILADISARLAGHGGGVSFVSFAESTGVLEVRFAGACRTCPLAAFTLEHGVATAVKEQIPAVLKVILVSS